MMRHTILDRRRAGVLLHPASLPGGDFGADAYRFADFLAEAGATVWQMLPLGPTHADGSPYHCQSVHAIHPRFISLERMRAAGWLTAAETALTCDAALAVALARLGEDEQAAMDEFVSSEMFWLDDFALYQALREEQAGRPWWEWPTALRDRDAEAIDAVRERQAARINAIHFEQFVAVRQFQALRDHARAKGVLLFGDMPIFVAHDSAEVWAHREQFKLDATGRPEVVAGVPPDYFSATGQRWGNPLYDWEYMQQDRFRWWLARLKTELARFDLVRVDHFRGFEACWEIPAGDETAINGRWTKVPGEALFDEVLTTFSALPLIAEDLGLITPEVHALRDKYGFPGMLVLQFAFYGGPDNPYLPHRHIANAVAYTGTHDNDTTLSWYEQLPAEIRQRADEYFGHMQEAMPWPLIRAAFMSVARMAVIPMQDLLGLGPGHRMNTPGTNRGNWDWRFEWSQVEPGLASRIKQLLVLYGRV
jgi:4-alpha-glucanotransferase